MASETLLDGSVTVDSDVLGGTPVFAGTRVPVENLFDWLGAGSDLDEFLAKFPRVQRAHALTVLRESSSSLLAKLGVRAA